MPPSIPLAQARRRLPQLIARVGQGDEVVITRRGKPVATLSSITTPPAQMNVAAIFSELECLRQSIVIRDTPMTRAREGLD